MESESFLSGESRGAIARSRGGFRTCSGPIRQPNPMCSLSTSPHCAPEVAESLQRMDWKTLLDQCLCPVFKRIRAESSFSYGSIFFDPNPLEIVRRELAEARSKATRPPFLVADMEMGPGHVLQGESEFPSMGAAGAVGDPDLARRAGLAAASAGREVGGLNWTLAPCVDLRVCRESPMVGVRSAGADVETVLKVTQAYVDGVQVGGCLATAKHFPGDGYNRHDQHLTTVTNPLSREEWEAGPGKIYRTLIDSSIGAIMPGHIALPSWDEPDAETGLYPPATLSRRLMTDLLRGELGFEGLIISDAIEMGGIVGYLNYYDACERFFNAGGDVLLFVIPDERFYIEMEKRIHRGSLPMETLRRAASRVWATKTRVGVVGDPRPIESLPREERERAAQEMARRAVTLVRDRRRMLPVCPKRRRILHVSLDQGARPRPDYFEAFNAHLISRGAEVTWWNDPGSERLFEAARAGDFDLIVCSIATGPSYGVGVVYLHGPLARNLMGGWMRFETPVIFVSLGHPTLHEDFEASMDTVINTYGISPHTVPAVCDVIFGKEKIVL